MAFDLFARKLFATFDCVMYAVTQNRPNTEELDKLAREKHHASPYTVRMLDALNAKGSALLTHISILVAVLALIKSSMKSSIEPANLKYECALTIMIVIYLVLSIFCLRVITVVIRPRGMKPFPSKLYLTEESRARQTAYNFASTITVVVTIITIAILIYGTFVS
jgi:hypothetical protein